MASMDAIATAISRYAGMGAGTPSVAAEPQQG
jgi:hypothetical protein